MRRASDQCGRANKNNADKIDAAKKYKNKSKIT